eukprot:gene10530-19257_t
MVDTLKTLALRVCSDFPEITYIQEGLEENKLCLKDDVYLPQDISEPLLETLLETRPLDYLAVFRDSTRCKLTKLDLKKKKTIKYQNLLCELFNHRVREIDLSNCFLNKNTAAKFEKLSGCLEILYLSGTKGSWSSDGAKFFGQLEKLRVLDISFTLLSFHCMNSISNVNTLTYLNISGCDVTSIVPLRSLKGTLEHLFMYDVNMKFANEVLQVIPELKSLTHLDISRDISVIEAERGQKFLDSVSQSQLMNLFGSLKELTYLDLSGFSGMKETDLAALRKSLAKNLEFLGLFGTYLEFHGDLPAKSVAGIANGAQILAALRFHTKRSSYILKALGVGYDFISQRNFDCTEEALKLFVAVSKQHLSSENIQIGASACICHLLGSPQAASFSPAIRRSTIGALIDVIEAHKLNSVLKNCLQCLYNFNFPAEMEFAFGRLSRQLLRILKKYTDKRLCRLAITLFNAIICHSSTFKLTVGRLGAIIIILDVIREKVGNSEEFEDDTELQRSMLGLMGNLAEVESLRCHFRVDSMLLIFMKLLDTSSYDFEVSYNAGGVLSHVCSDGDEEWQSKTISRQECMDAVVRSVQEWDVESSRNINYRSLKPMLRLIPLDNNRCGQEWSIWALANLTKVYPQKYCELLVEEGGKELLDSVLHSETASQSMKRFARMIIDTINSTGRPMVS